MHYLSEQSCGLEQANHRKQMSINHIDPTGHWGGTSLVACMFILLTRGEGEQSKSGTILHNLLFYSFTWNLLTDACDSTLVLIFALTKICFKLDACICISEKK